MIDLNSPVFVSGHRGMVGAAVVRRLQELGYSNLITRSRRELDLTRQGQVEEFYAEHRPVATVFCAGRVGGIHANNSLPANFIYENIAMAANSIHAAYKSNSARFLYLGSTCIYPRLAPQPIAEESLLTGGLEKTNEAYAIAKISGVKLCEFYRKQYGVKFHSAMPTNLYGPGDNYHPKNSHVLPAMLQRFHKAVEDGRDTVTIWGSGTPLREFLHVDDLAAAVIHLLRQQDPPDLVNVGSGEEVSILELAKHVAATVGFSGQIDLDPSKPDGTPRKLCDNSKLKTTGWKPQISLVDGLRDTYECFLKEANTNQLRSR